jgi:hypothetical protein
MRTEGQADATKLVVAVHNVTKKRKDRSMADHIEIFTKTRVTNLT